MEPVTHFLTGACIGRAGLNRKTAYATVAAVDVYKRQTQNGPARTMVLCEWTDERAERELV